nr:MAG TPA_asm: hypothetical protein [Caudoviricetes sp.]
MAPCRPKFSRFSAESGFRESTLRSKRQYMLSQGRSF